VEGVVKMSLFLLGLAAGFGLLLLFAIWWTNGNIFFYMWFAFLVFIERLRGRNPFL
jgi:hypothetical protein